MAPAFSNVLTAEQIAQLPDDPDEFENAINQLAGPGAQIRVNGFRGGKLPPKSQIREIRFRMNPYARRESRRRLWTRRYHDQTWRELVAWLVQLRISR